MDVVLQNAQTMNIQNFEKNDSLKSETMSPEVQNAPYWSDLRVAENTQYSSWWIPNIFNQSQYDRFHRFMAARASSSTP